jgi:hypothetical protein
MLMGKAGKHPFTESFCNFCQKWHLVLDRIPANFCLNNSLLQGHQNVVKVVLDDEGRGGIGMFSPPHDFFQNNYFLLGVQHSASNLLGVARNQSEDPKDLKKKKKEKNTLSKNTSRLFSGMSARSKALPANFTFLDLLPEELRFEFETENQPLSLFH